MEVRTLSTAKTDRRCNVLHAEALQCQSLLSQWDEIVSFMFAASFQSTQQRFTKRLTSGHKSVSAERFPFSRQSTPFGRSHRAEGPKNNGWTDGRKTQRHIHQRDGLCISGRKLGQSISASDFCSAHRRACQPTHEQRKARRPYMTPSRASQLQDLKPTGV